MLTKFYDAVTCRLRASGQWVALLPLRGLLAYEFWTAGSRKLDAGSDAPGWFANQDFVFPFGLFSADTNWLLVTWGELVAAVAVALGLFTRFFAFALLVITVVAIAAVHWPASFDSLGQLWEGYSVSRVMDDGEFRGNFRIPFLFLAMILPLIFFGGGKLSLDHLLLQAVAPARRRTTERADPASLAVAGLVFGALSVYLLPAFGAALLVLSTVALGRAVYLHRQSSDLR